MATVYITKELKQRIKQNINKMRMQEIHNDVPGYDAKKPVEATELYHLGCWGSNNTHLLHTIPREWLRVEKSCSIRITGTDEHGKDVNFHQEFEALTPAFYARPSTDYWNRADSTLSMEVVHDMPEETLGRAEILERWNNEAVVRSINARWQKVEDDLMDFFDKCKSLNEAVKLFPTSRMYIHREDLERLDRKVERPSQRRKLVEEVDTDGLTAAAIAAKLMAAT